MMEAAPSSFECCMNNSARLRGVKVSLCRAAFRAASGPFRLFWKNGGLQMIRSKERVESGELSVESGELKLREREESPTGG